MDTQTLTNDLSAISLSDGPSRRITVKTNDEILELTKWQWSKIPCFNTILTSDSNQSTPSEVTLDMPSSHFNACLTYAETNEPRKLVSNLPATTSFPALYKDLNVLHLVLPSKTLEEINDDLKDIYDEDLELGAATAMPPATLP
ncbi:hypothetical protein HDV00_002517 [Rhizophlyctis rosea]|nr:hypothetical protein HDV00_002517 [Rhizophlyctis rosea]